MRDATTITANDVIDALSRCVQDSLTLIDDQRYLRAADAALTRIGDYFEQQIQKKVIENFDDALHEDDLAEIHAYYEAIDNAETEG